MKICKQIFLASILLVGLLSSCSKDNDTVPAKTTSHVFFMDTYDEKLYKLSIDTGTMKATKDLANMAGVGIAYDSKNEKIYFSDFANDSTPDGKIWKMDVNGANAKAIVSGIQDPYGVAVDANGGKVYWGDDNGNISRCNLDGSNLQTGIVHITDGGMRGIAVDATNKKIYFYEVNNNNLYRANLDGTGSTVILTGYYGYGIAVDEVNGKIYFDAQTDDESVSALYRANLDGTSPTLVDDTQSRIYGIAVDSKTSKLYWSARDTYEIYQANLNGTGKVTLAKDLGSPRGICIW